MLVTFIDWPMMPEKKLSIKGEFKMKKITIGLATVFTLAAFTVVGTNHEKFPESIDAPTINHEKFPESIGTPTTDHEKFPESIGTPSEQVNL